MKTFSCAAFAPMRMRSPRTAPPLIGLDGSMAITAIVWPARQPGAEQGVDERRLAAARHAGDADDPGAAGALGHPRRRVARAGAVVVDQRQQARERAALTPARARSAQARRGRSSGHASDDDQRLAEAEVAAQARADLLVRQAGAGAVDDGAEDVAVARSRRRG